MKQYILMAMFCTSVIAQAGLPVILPADPSQVEMTAAHELAFYLHKITGDAYPVLNEPSAAPSAIFIGQTKAFQKAFPDIALDKLPADTIVLKSHGGSLYLAGHPQRGTLYAVYTFLEDFCGIRWWTSTEETVPRRPAITIPEKLDIVYSPPLVCRETFYKDAFSDIFSAKLKNNGHFAVTSPAYGDHMSIIGWCHTFAQFIPVEKYYNDHPDWFALVDGKRQGGKLDFQLCLTNEDMTKEFIRICLEKIKANPTAGMISVSQNDAFQPKPCQCPACTRLVEENGAQSGPLIHFVNKVAEAIEKEYPDFLVETLAYQYTMQPPKKIRPRRNVVIRLCTGLNAVQTIENGKDNQGFKRLLEAWSAIAPKLYVWHYIANFHNYMVPYPDYLHFADDIRLFVKNHAVGLFEQGDSGCTVGDFVAARAWIISHLLWNPQLDEKALMNEFFTGYYGAAADALLRYWQLTVDAVVKAGIHLHVGGDIPPGWMTDDVLRDCMKLFDEAEAVVNGQPEYLSRVRKARLGIDLCAIKRHIASLRHVRFQNAKPEDVFLLPDAEKRVEDFIERTKDAGNICEGGAFGDYALNLRKQLKIEAPSDTPELCADLPSGKWDSFQENRFRLIRPGEWVDVVDDPAASNGKAAAMPGDSPQWAVQVPMGGYPNNLPWVVYYSVRCDADATDGTAFTCGLHNNGTGGDHFITHHAVSECSGKSYKLFKSNPVSIPEDGYLWFCPPARPKSQVGKIYIDRVFIIQENMPQQH